MDVLPSTNALESRVYNCRDAKSPNGPDVQDTTNTKLIYNPSPSKDEVIHVVQELCGLGGILAPSQRSNGPAFGRVVFDAKGYHTATISYYDTTTNHSAINQLATIGGILKRFNYAAGFFQENRLCCDSFTIMRRLPIDHTTQDIVGKIEMCRIPLDICCDLLASIESLFPHDNLNIPNDLESYDSKRLQEMDLEPIIERSEQILDIVRGRIVPFPHFRPQHGVSLVEYALHVCSLAVQVLCVGFVSYCQAHVGHFNLFFLTKPLYKLKLLGYQNIQGYGNPPTWEVLTISLNQLTCMEEMLHRPVLALSSNATQTILKEPKNLKFDILASPEDLIDTWGPGQLFWDSSRSWGAGHDMFAAIKLGRGMIYWKESITRATTWSTFTNLGMWMWNALNESPNSLVGGDGKYHWSLDPVFEKKTRKFHAHEKICIGAFTTINKDCKVEISQHYRLWEAILEPVSTFGEYWMFTQRQLTLQAGLSGGPASGQIQGGYTETLIPGTTLKHQILINADDLSTIIPMLNNSWGLQVSICTGVARRIPLRELLAEVIPKFIKMKPLVSRDKEMWKVLTRKHHIIKALKGTRMKDLKEWQIELKDEKLENLVIRMIRSVLSALERTGVVEDGKKKLRIAWIVESDILRCFEIPCEGKYAWTQILKDSPYCATFAYYTTKCFSTGHIDCCKIHLPGSGWKCAFPTLETAVWYHDKNVRENLNSEPLEHNKCYLIGESKLTARFEKRNGERMPTLFIRSLSTKVDPRYWLGKKRRIRERQLYNSLFAENVMVEAVN